MTETVRTDAASELDLERENRRLEGASAEERLAFAVERFGEGLLFTSSFGAQSAVLLHLWSRVAGALPVVFVDTGFSFSETLEYRDMLAERLRLTVRVLRPDIAHDEFVQRWGDSIQRDDPDFCCGINKVAPLAHVRSEARAWVSGLRRDQSATRADVAILELEPRPERPPLVRVHPLATFTKKDVTEYLAAHGLPEHPLTRRRYLSIGCVPCTRAIDAAADGADERAGRWAWGTKTECGLHARRADRR